MALMASIASFRHCEEPHTTKAIQSRRGTLDGVASLAMAALN
jgi:hypothetical protein